jgi:hypothetical protein
MQLRNFQIVDKVLRQDLKLKYDKKMIARCVGRGCLAAAYLVMDVLFGLYIVCRVWTEQYGAAASLLVKVKDWVKAARQPKAAYKGHEKALASLRPRPYERKVGPRGLWREACPSHQTADYLYTEPHPTTAAKKIWPGTRLSRTHHRRDRVGELQGGWPNITAT